MRSRCTAALVVAALGTAPASSPALAQPVFDRANEFTLRGTVLETRLEKGAALVAVLSVEDRTVEVTLGPASFLQEMEFALEKGDPLVVVGWRTPAADAERLVAREVTRGQVSMILRDEKGVPAWAPRRP